MQYRVYNDCLWYILCKGLFHCENNNFICFIYSATSSVSVVPPSSHVVMSFLYSLILWSSCTVESPNLHNKCIQCTSVYWVWLEGNKTNCEFSRKYLVCVWALCNSYIMWILVLICSFWCSPLWHSSCSFCWHMVPADVYMYPSL